MRGRPAGQTVRRTVFGGRAFSPPPYGRLRRPALRAVSLRLAGACGGQGPVFCGLCRRAAGRKPRQKSRKPAITHENPGEGSDCAGRRPGGSAAETGCARLPAAALRRRAACGPLPPPPPAGGAKRGRPQAAPQKAILLPLLQHLGVQPLGRQRRHGRHHLFVVLPVGHAVPLIVDGQHRHLGTALPQQGAYHLRQQVLTL